MRSNGPRTLRRPGAVVALGLAVLLLLAACGGDEPDAASEGDRTTTTAGSDAGSGSSDADDDVADGDDPTGGSDAEDASRVPVPAALDPAAIPISSADFETASVPVRPVRLRIDAIEVDAPVIDVGLTPEREMELPGAVEAAWYRYGARPGTDEGSAVVAAHVDWNGEEGPFFHLRELSDGDEVLVELSDGDLQRYRITEVTSYAKEDLPISDLFRLDGDPRLVLVTCGGEFDERTRSYDDNVVALADAVGPPIPATSS